MALGATCRHHAIVGRCGLISAVAACVRWFWAGGFYYHALPPKICHHQNREGNHQQNDAGNHGGVREDNEAPHQNSNENTEDHANESSHESYHALSEDWKRCSARSMRARRSLERRIHRLITRAANVQ